MQRVLLGPQDQDVRRLRVRIQLWLTTLLVVTNVIGAGIIVALNLLIVPGGPSRELWLTLAVAVPVYVAAAVAIGLVVITRATLRELRWALSNQTPTQRQRRSALRLPWRITRVQLGLWFGAVVLFTVLTIVVQPAAWLSTFAGVSIAGIVVSAIAFLLTEFVLRPIAARALADQGEDREIVSGVRRRMLIFWFLGTGAPTLGMVTAAIVALTNDEVEIVRLSFAIIALSAVLLVFGLLVTFLTAQSVVAPIESVREALGAVQAGEFDVEVPVDDSTELGLLQAGFNEMAAGLRERERIRDLFGRHVGESVAQAATHADVELGGQKVEVTVLMIDLIGSTGYAADRDPVEVVEMLNRFFTVVVEEVDHHSGLVNKFMGDAVLAIFGAPMDIHDHAGAALAAARSIMSRLGDEVSEIGAGIGVSTGEAVAGNVGAASRFEFTVIGDAVNASSRLCELAKDVPGHVLASRTSVDAASESERAAWEDAGEQTLRGRNRPTPLSRLRDS